MVALDRLPGVFKFADIKPVLCDNMKASACPGFAVAGCDPFGVQHVRNFLQAAALLYFGKNPFDGCGFVLVHFNRFFICSVLIPKGANTRGLAAFACLCAASPCKFPGNSHAFPLV